MRPLEELISQNEPGIDLICQWADSAKNHYEILPPSPQRDDVLLNQRMELRPILTAILEDYALPPGGDHGVAHWARVFENGLRLAGETGANVEVVSLFAILHDSRRINEVTDPEHGPRAAEFAAEI